MFPIHNPKRAARRLLSLVLLLTVSTSWAAMPYAWSVAAQENNTVTASPSTVTAASPVTVEWTAPSGHSSTDWVGLYAVGAPDTNALAAQYTGSEASSGTLIFTAPDAAGQYEFRYFTDDTFNKVATSNTVSVAAQANNTVRASPSTVTAASPVTVEWTAPSGHSSTDWVGLYAVGAPDTNALAAQYTGSEASSGTLIFTAPDAAGQYEFRYFTDDTFNKVATSNTVSVTAAVILPTDIVRFLEQSTFGPTFELIAHVQNIGIEAYLDEQFNAPVSGYPTLDLWPATRPAACTGTCQRDNYTMYPLQVQFYSNALYAPDQLRQRLAFALHKILVVSGRDFGQPSHVAPYLQVLDRNAFGNFRTLLNEITLNTAMGYYLDMRRSARASPNENYAREIMQLFSIGLFQLNQDGTLILDEDGNPIPTYDQETVNELSKAFTGWFEPAQVMVSYPPIVPTPVAAPDYITPLRVWLPEATFHHPGEKHLLNYPGAPDYGLGPGVLPPNQSTQTDLDRALDNIYNHPNVAPFISKQLIQQLVTSNPRPAYVERISAVFNSNRSSDRQLFEVVKAILLDPEARGNVKTDPNYGKLREPVMFITNLVRAFSGNSDGVLNNVTVSMGPPPNINVAIGAAAMDQDVLRPPTVFSYFPPDYEVSGTDIPAGTLGPEFGILSTVTTLTRANFVQQLVFSGIPPAPPDRPDGTQLDLSGWLPLASDSQELVYWLDFILLHGTMSNEMRGRIVDAVNVIPESNPALRVRQAVYLIATSSQYQVER